METTLKALKSGELLGTKRLKLACGLTTFPEEILSLSASLEVLDLSDNNLSELPESMSQLKKLKILFVARNNFTQFPKVLKDCPSLNMIGFKSNQITTVPENVFPPQLNWLILTDNKIESLPKSIGDCLLLQKCALAGNQITELPIEMSNCVNLELLRISANKLKTLPEWLFNLPKLSWIAFGGNPATFKNELTQELESFEWSDFTINNKIGEGASGFIYNADWHSKKKPVALKIFKGAVTSDGLPDDEMQIAIAAGLHDNLIPVLGKLKNHPEAKSGLIMTLISSHFTNLGNPPNFETCTRDTFNAFTVFNEQELLSLAKGIASVSFQLHCKGINHGDLYAHNILVDTTATPILGDFGAASFYDVNAKIAAFIQRVEVRAYACFLEDILNLVNSTNVDFKTKWQKLINDCSNVDVKSRPSFSEIMERLAAFN